MEYFKSSFRIKFQLLATCEKEVTLTVSHSQSSSANAGRIAGDSDWLDWLDRAGPIRCDMIHEQMS